ncbi:MAG TPA: ATP-binding cassette domain-containing protein [Opitutaceae bacterium]|nr:ATP-binding cassette domain-containing protein [Opitutaceae bacterium]
MPLLQLSSVETDIAGSRILRGVQIEVNPGEVVALMGRNGVGKTTTLKSITGMLPVRAGAITFNGERINKFSADQRARAGIGYVPQGRDIFPHMTVEENLHVGLVVHGRKGADARNALERVYELFPVLKQMLSRKGGVLSGGQQQQLAIGRALLTDPKLLILDEPTEGIQPSIIDQIGDTLKKLKSEGPRRYLVEEVDQMIEKLRAQGVSDKDLHEVEHCIAALRNDGPSSERMSEVADLLGAVRTKNERPEIVEPIGHALKKLKGDGSLAILLVEQFVDFCREVADRFYAMDRGAVVASGPIASLTDEVVKKHLQV